MSDLFGYMKESVTVKKVAGLGVRLGVGAVRLLCSNHLRPTKGKWLTEHAERCVHDEWFLVHACPTAMMMS